MSICEKCAHWALESTEYPCCACEVVTGDVVGLTQFERKAEPPKVADTECPGRGVDVEKSGTKLYLACVKCGRAVHATNTGCPGCGADLTKALMRIWTAAPKRGTWEDRRNATTDLWDGNGRFRCAIDDSVRTEHLTDEPSPGNEDGHYSGTIQPIDLIRAQGMDFEEGSVIKYVSRYKKKNGLEDLKKARWYIDRLIERFEKW